MEQTQNAYKMYVRVGVEFTEHGVMHPIYVVTNDGQRWEVSKVRHVERAASRRAGGCGIRYTVLINQREANLYFEDTKTPRWFVELRHAAS